MADCTACGRPAVAFLRYSGHHYCKKHFNNLYWKRVKRHLAETKMVEKGDKVMIAASGGKDSTALLHIMAKIFGKRPDIKIFAVTIDEGAKGYRSQSAKVVAKHCKNLGVEQRVYTFKKLFGKSIDEIVGLLRKKGEPKSPCSFCGVLRRYALNKVARELGCNKVATAHNLDDEVQSVMMNLMRGQARRMARLGPVAGVGKQDGFVRRIKPLRKIPEKENAVFVFLNNIEIEKGKCPYRGEAYRGKVRSMLNRFEVEHPGTKFTVLETFDRILPVLKESQKGEKPNTCEKCGELTSSSVCKTCEIMEMIRDGEVVPKRGRGNRVVKGRKGKR